MRKLLCFLLFTSLMYAQDKILLEGHVLNDTIEKASLTVVNISLRKGTITNESGRFTIEARENDTINISAVQYESKQFVVTPSVFKKKKIAFYLIPKVTELDPVNISNIDLTGNLKDDTEQTKTDRSLRAKIRGVPENTAPFRTREERLLYTATTRGADQVGRKNLRLDIPLAALINGISGKTKRLKKLVEVSNLQRRVDAMRYRFSDSLYTKDFKIPPALIDDFMMYLYERDDSLQRNDNYNPLVMIELMSRRAKEYVELINSEEAHDSIPRKN